MNFFHEAFAPNQPMQFCPVAKGPVSLEQSEEHPRDAIVKEHCSMLLDQLNYMNDAMQDYFEEEGMPSAKSYHSAVETLCRDLLGKSSSSDATPSQTMEYGEYVDYGDEYTGNDGSTGNDDDSDYGTDDRADAAVDMDDDTKRSFLETIAEIDGDYDYYVGNREPNEFSKSLYGYNVWPGVEFTGSPSQCIPHTGEGLNYDVKLAEIMCDEDIDCNGFNYYAEEGKTCFTDNNYAADRVEKTGVTHYAVEEPAKPGTLFR